MLTTSDVISRWRAVRADPVSCGLSGANGPTEWPRPKGRSPRQSHEFERILDSRRRQAGLQKTGLRAVGQSFLALRCRRIVLCGLVAAHSLRAVIKMARKSFTLVRVGPMTT